MRLLLDGSNAAGHAVRFAQLTCIAMLAVFVCLFPGVLYAQAHWTPYFRLFAIHDDNILFSADDTEDDYVYAGQPGLKLDYRDELTRLNADARAIILRYQDFDELDDEIYRFNLNGLTRMTERFRLRGRYEFIKDTTLDSELDEIGRIFQREDRFSHRANLSPSYNLTERASIGISADYRDVEYDTEELVDYTAWEVGTPFRWKLATEIDALFIVPGYSRQETDTSRSDSYRMRIGWDHETTERLNLTVAAGARYTEQERDFTDETDESWGALGDLQLNYLFQTGAIVIDFRHDLYNTAVGDLVNVSRVDLELEWNFTERLGLNIEGLYIYTRNEGDDDTRTTEYVEATPELFYRLSENYIVFVAYEYSQYYRKNVDEDSRAERNRVWAGLRAAFPLF